MRPDLLEPHRRVDSPVHRAAPPLKLVVAFGLVLTVVVSPREAITPLLVVAGLVVALAALSRVPWRFLLWRVVLVEPFVLGTALLALLEPGGGRRFLLLVARCTLSVAVVVLLSATTPFSELLKVLRALRAPALLVTTASLAYRYLFVVVDETGRLKRARASRTFSRRRELPWRSLAGIVSELFVRSSERAERIYAAMGARGWR